MIDIVAISSEFARQFEIYCTIALKYTKSLTFKSAYLKIIFKYTCANTL